MSTSRAVVDAGLVVFRVITPSTQPLVVRAWEQFQHDKVTLYAPRLWRYEVTSVIHAHVYAGALTPEEGERALQTAWEFGVNLVGEDDALCLAAFRWATRLRQRPAYDAFYLAVAERTGAELWTTDRRLYHNVRGLGIHWVHAVEEA
jgi:predicted nucleic acid-binding protein